MTPPYLCDMGLRLRPVWPLEGAKFFLQGRLSPQRLQISQPFFRYNVPLLGLYTAPLSIGGTDSPFGGQVPPTENLHFWNVIFFALPLRCVASLVIHSVGALEAVKFSWKFNPTILRKVDLNFWRFSTKVLVVSPAGNLLRRLLRLDDL